jgi:hypothetical protein
LKSALGEGQKSESASGEARGRGGLGGGELAMLTVTQIARRIPWLIMGLILVGGLLHLFGPAELIVIGALIVALICFQVWLRRRGV